LKLSEYVINLKNTTKHFLTVCPRDGTYMGANMGPVSLSIVQDDGVDFVPDIDIVVNDLASGVKHFQNNNGKGDKFTVSCVFKEDMQVSLRVPNEETIGPGWDMVEYTLMEVVDYWIRNMTPLNVVTEAVDIEDGLYIITNNSSRKQTHKGVSIWSLEFTRYETFTYTAFQGSSSGVDKAIKNYNAALEKAKKKKEADKKKKAEAKKKTTATYKFAHECDYKKCKYTKKKTVVKCVKYLQAMLNKRNGCKLAKDGWYGDSTKKEVKKYQEKHKKKYSLNPTGNLDKNTYLVLTGNGSKIGKKTTGTTNKKK